MNRLKLFGKPQRISLFRQSLFSSLTRRTPNTTGEGADNVGNESEFKCPDCGNQFTEHGDVADAPRCPVCGSGRVRRVSEVTWRENEATFSGTAELGESLFSNIEFTLCRKYPGQDSFEDSLNRLSGLPVKSITLIRRAHVPAELSCDCDESYDRLQRYSGETLRMPEFVRVLDTEYPGAPDNILDLLTGKGIITISGTRVLVR